MNQEQNNVGNVNSNNTNVTAVNNSVPISPQSTAVVPSAPPQQPSNILAGSPGVVVAPVSSEPTDASNADKGRVNGIVRSATETEQTLSQTTMINPTVVVPKVDVPPPVAPPPTAEEPAVSSPAVVPSKKSRKSRFFIILLLLVIAGMGFYIFQDYQKDLAQGECSPLVASDDTLRELEINSPIVQELYDKVKTTIREDVAYHNFDDTFKLYLAYRQIPASDIYDSNCNLFNESAMSNFSCNETLSFVPKAFKVETLEREVRKLFGESVTIPNIVLIKN